MTDEVQSPTVKIDDKEYLEADLSKEQMELLNMARYLAPKEQEAQNQLSLIQDHKRRLILELKNSLEGNNNIIAGDEGSFIVGGNGGSVDIQQVGDNNVVTGGQFSDTNTMSVYQQGDYNVATVVQY